MMNKLNLMVKIGVTFVIYLILAGCVTQPQKKYLNTDVKGIFEPIKQGEKLYPVVLSVSFNTGNTFPYLLVESLSEKTEILGKNKIYSINVINNHASSSTFVYSGKLPAGEYRLTELSTLNSGGGVPDYRYISLSNKNEVGLVSNFKVEENTTTDLGRIILTHANDKYFISRAENIPSNKSLVTKLGKNYLEAIYKDRIFTGWEQPLTRQEKHFGNIEKILPFGMNCIKEKKDNVILAASKIGSVFYLPLENKVKNSKIIQTKDGLNLHCITVKENSDFDFLAYGEMNALYKYQKVNDVLTPIDTGNLPIGIVVSVVGDEKNGWFIAHLVDKKVTIYRSDRLEKGDWKPMVTKDTYHNPLINGFWMWEDDKGFDYAEMFGSINRFDYATKKWTENRVPNDANITKLVINPDQSFSLITSMKSGLAGVFANQFNSKDHGVTWQKIDSPFKVNMWPIQYSKQGDRYVVATAFSPKTLALTEDMGKTWQKHQIMPYSSIVVLNSGALLNIRSTVNYATVTLSEDKGKTWSGIYNSHNKALENLEKSSPKR